MAGRGTSWTQDYPRADRHFALALRRLTRISVRSIEQPVNLDDGDDVYNWPWLCAGEMGDWKLTENQVQKLRDYLLRGGFLMLDDFWGSEEWNRFYESMQKVFPDRPIVEIADADSIFHTVYDLDDRYQVPGEWAIRRGTTYRNGEQGGAVAHWRGIMTIRAVSWWPCLTIPISEIPGSGPTIPNIRKNIRLWGSGSA